MNINTVGISMCAAALALGADGAAREDDAAAFNAHGLDREAIHAGLAGYESPPARELAREITREIVGAQGGEAPSLADFCSPASGVRPQEAKGIPVMRAAGGGQSGRDAGGQNFPGLLAWLRAGLGKLAALLAPRNQG